MNTSFSDTIINTQHTLGIYILPEVIGEILGFDPYVDFHAKSIKLFRSNVRILEDIHFPTKVFTFFKNKTMKFKK